MRQPKKQFDRDFLSTPPPLVLYLVTLSLFNYPKNLRFSWGPALDIYLSTLPLYPPPFIREGEIEEEGLTPLLNTPLGRVGRKEVIKQAVIMAYLPYPLYPLPLIKGKGNWFI